jgi:hypothetical protein
MRNYPFVGTYDVPGVDEPLTQVGYMLIDKSEASLSQGNLRSRVFGHVIDTNYGHCVGTRDPTDFISFNPLFNIVGNVDGRNLRFDKISHLKDVAVAHYSLVRKDRKEPEPRTKGAYPSVLDAIVGQYDGEWNVEMGKANGAAYGHKGDASITVSNPERIVIKEYEIGSLGWTQDHFYRGRQLAEERIRLD